MSFELLDALAALAIKQDSALGCTELSGVFAPKHSSGLADINASFIAAKLSNDRVGLAYSRLPAFVNSLHEPTLIAPTQDVIAQVRSQDHNTRVRALAALNAVLNHNPSLQLANQPTPKSTLLEFDGAQTIGMVGLFSSLASELHRAGHTIHVIELDPTLWRQNDRLNISANLSELQHCHTVFCTATVLLNDTFDAVRSAAKHCNRFVLMGPSTPLAPSVFELNGVTHLAGRHIENTAAFWHAWQRAENWSQYAAKFIVETKKAPTP